MSSRRLLPDTHPTFAQKDVIDTIGESKRFRNPFRVELDGSFPRKHDQRRADHRDNIGMETELRKKGRPI